MNVTAFRVGDDAAAAERLHQAIVLLRRQMMRQIEFAQARRAGLGRDFVWDGIHGGFTSRCANLASLQPVGDSLRQLALRAAAHVHADVADVHPQRHIVGSADELFKCR